MKMNMRRILLIFCAGAVLLLSACGNGEKKKPDGDPAAQGETGEINKPLTGTDGKREEKEPYEYSPEEYEDYARTWLYTEKLPDGERVYRLILGDEEMAQLVVQTGIGDLLFLSAGRWYPSAENELTLELTADMRDGADLGEEEREVFGGVYRAVRDDYHKLFLGCEDGATAILPDMEKGEALFYDERYRPEVLDEIVRAADAYYRAVNGEDYPGDTLIEEVGPEGVLVHLVEDMGDHTATAGWYLVDPFSLTGSDEITGETIEFASYLYG